MDRFIRHENIKHYRELLARTTDRAERERVEKLLTEEEAKDRPDPIPAKDGPASHSQR